MPRTEPPAAVRVGWDLAQRLLLRTGAGERGEPGVDAAAGRVASGASGLWQPATDGAVAREGRAVNRKRVGRLLELMGVEVVYPKRNLSQPGEGHRIYPYLLEGLEISGPDQVWCSDITYVPMAYGFMYLVAVMDWWSRYVLAWELSNSLDSEFCIRAWTRRWPAGGTADLQHRPGQPVHQRSVSGGGGVGRRGCEHGRAGAVDRQPVHRAVMAQRQTGRHLCAGLRRWVDGPAGIGHWFGDYNTVRPHQALGYATPGEWYHSPESYGAKPAAWRWK